MAIKRKNLAYRFTLSAFFCIFLIFSFLFFSKALNRNWIYVGDSLNSLMGYSFHYSGIARGEYAIWNPLVRAGDNEVVFQMFGLANPLSNFVILGSVLLKLKDIVFSYSFYIYLMVIIYVSGMFFLLRVLTKNRYAAVLAAALALSSSSVCFYTYHVFFITILYAVPWMLYSLVSYFQELRLRYIVIFTLSFCLFLYSYEAVMGIIYLGSLFFSYCLFYYKGAKEKLKQLGKINPGHVFLFFLLMVIFSLPMVIMFFEYRSGLLPISRVANIAVTEKFGLVFDKLFSKSHWFAFSSPKFFVNFFTGFIFQDFNEIRHYIGPVAAILFISALFSFRRRIYCLAFAGALVGFFSGDIFPVNLLLKLPLLESIRNLHFLMQFFVMNSIILAVFGFDLLLRKRTLWLKKGFNFAVIIIFLASLSCFVSVPFGYRLYDSLTLALVLAACAALFYCVNFVTLAKQPVFIVIIGLFSCISSFAMISSIPVLSGGITENSELLTLRNRRAHGLVFLRQRPSEIKTIDLGQAWDKWETDFGKDEYYSLLALTDNSYKSEKKSFGLSSFPVLNEYYLFLSIPGHEKFLNEKFFFFRNYYTSNDPADMYSFVKNPGLLEEMLSMNQAVIFGYKGGSYGMPLGEFKQFALTRGSSQVSAVDDFSVKVRDYKANRIKLDLFLKHPGLFTFTDFWAKGWAVKVDGKNACLQRVFYAFKGVFLPAGNHKVEFFYRDSAYYYLVLMHLVFLLCLVILAISLLKPLIRRRLWQNA
ncbi:MAG: YfhO family protein [Candidatus Omnitrophica bacterium]|nr:YfhO family protein [Candidatus Omnitrophota bacterium]MDD5652703.1 YfhO family protein [Candidatus Omnitrophota bacterium]